MKLKPFLIVLILSLVSLAWAVDTISNKAVSARHGGGRFHYHAAVAVDSIASGDINYTQAMYIPANSNFYARVISSEVGTEDFNIFFEYASDPEGTWYVDATNSAFDAVGTTAVADTVNVIAGASSILAETLPWMRVKIVNGQAITAAATVTVDIGGDAAADVDLDDLPNPQTVD